MRFVGLVKATLHDSLVFCIWLTVVILPICGNRVYSNIQSIDSISGHAVWIKSARLYTESRAELRLKRGFRWKVSASRGCLTHFRIHQPPCSFPSTYPFPSWINSTIHPTSCMLPLKYWILYYANRRVFALSQSRCRPTMRRELRSLLLLQQMESTNPAT